MLIVASNIYVNSTALQKPQKYIFELADSQVSDTFDRITEEPDFIWYNNLGFQSE